MPLNRADLRNQSGAGQIHRAPPNKAVRYQPNMPKGRGMRARQTAFQISPAYRCVSLALCVLCVKVEPEHDKGKLVHQREIGGEKFSVQTDANFLMRVEIYECLTKSKEMTFSDSKVRRDRPQATHTDAILLPRS